jgi:hypothetical protein
MHVRVCAERRMWLCSWHYQPLQLLLLTESRLLFLAWSHLLRLCLCDSTSAAARAWQVLKPLRLMQWRFGYCAHLSRRMTEAMLINPHMREAPLAAEVADALLWTLFQVQTSSFLSGLVCMRAQVLGCVSQQSQ